MTQATMHAPEPGTSVGIGGFWHRFVAFAIDIVIINILTFPIGLAFPPQVDIANWTFSAHPLGPILDFLVISAYLIGLEGAKGATFGKMLLGLKVVGETGQPIGFGTAVGRNFAKVLSVLIVGIGFIMAGFDPRKQALHDKLAKTLVVKK